MAAGASVALVAALVGVGFVVISGLVNGGPQRHLDGQGILGSGAAPGNSWNTVWPSQVTQARSVGIRLRLTQGDNPAVLESISAGGSVGRIRYLGSYMREFLPTAADPPIGSAAGFPPSVPDRLVSVRGFVVSNTCPVPGSPSGLYDELVTSVSSNLCRP